MWPCDQIYLGTKTGCNDGWVENEVGRETHSLSSDTCVGHIEAACEAWEDRIHRDEIMYRLCSMSLWPISILRWKQTPSVSKLRCIKGVWYTVLKTVWDIGTMNTPLSLPSKCLPHHPCYSLHLSHHSLLKHTHLKIKGTPNTVKEALTEPRPFPDFTFPKMNQQINA